MSDIKEGDVVQLKSGSPAMTVINIDNEEVQCAWFVKGKQENGKFPISAIEKRGRIALGTRLSRR